MGAAGAEEAPAGEGGGILTDSVAVWELPLSKKVEGVMAHVAPAGTPAPQASVTVPVYPRIGDAVKVAAAIVPAGMSNVGGLAVTVKSGDSTITVTGAVVADAKSCAPSKYAVMTLVPNGRIVRKL